MLLRSRIWETIKIAHEAVRASRDRGKKKHHPHDAKDWKIVNDAYRAVQLAMGKSIDISKLKHCSAGDLKKLAVDLRCLLSENDIVTKKANLVYRSAKLNAILHYRQKFWDEESKLLRNDPELRRDRARSLVDETLQSKSISFSSEAQAIAFSLSRPDLSKERHRIVRLPDLKTRRDILSSGGPHLVLEAEDSVRSTFADEEKFKLLTTPNQQGKHPDSILYRIWLDMGQDASSLTRDS